MNRYSESHLVNFERRVNAFRAWLDENPTVHPAWGRWIADEGYNIMLEEIRRCHDFERQVMESVLEQERVVGAD